MQLVFVIEQADDQYLAYCDELRAVASGATEEEAVANLKTALVDLLEEYGSEVRARLARRKMVAVEI